MKFKKIKNTAYVEVAGTGILINTVDDALEILGNAYYQGFDKIIVDKKYFTADFFDLKTRLAGEILQKFSTYRMRIAIIGDFSAYKSKSLQDFIRESNKGTLVNFLNSIEEAVKR